MIVNAKRVEVMLQGIPKKDVDLILNDLNKHYKPSKIVIDNFEEMKSQKKQLRGIYRSYFSDCSSKFLFKNFEEFYNFSIDEEYLPSIHTLYTPFLKIIIFKLLKNLKNLYLDFEDSSLLNLDVVAEALASKTNKIERVALCGFRQVNEESAKNVINLILRSECKRLDFVSGAP